MATSNITKRLVGGYLIGFNILSDNLANGAKWFISKVHSVLPTIALISIAHKGVVQLEKTRDKLSLTVHKYAYCTKCRGRGYLVVMSVGGEYVGKESCPQCHGSGKDYKAILGKVEENLKLPFLSKRETAVVVFDKMLDKAREERLIQNIYCKHCKGQRLVHMRDEQGKYLGQKPCPHCSGTGKDYKSMYSEIAKTCIKDYLIKGHSKDDAWQYCMNLFIENVEQAVQGNVISTFYLPSEEKAELNFPPQPEMAVRINAKAAMPF